MQIGRYDILLELARGGMAHIFVAVREGSREPRVLKRLLADLGTHVGVSRRFQREAMIASLIDHPNIARLVDSNFEGKEAFLVMEYIAGQTIESMVEVLRARGKVMPLGVAIAILMRVLDGLSYAHELRHEGRPLDLVHRDLSPRNVMVGYAGEVKIIDFGVARANIDDYRTEPGVLIGTIQYFSPEQAAGEPVDLRSDLYSISAVAYEMLLGKPLVPITSAIDMVAKILRLTPPKLSELDPQIPPAIDRVIRRGLARDREARWQSAHEMSAALLDAAHEAGIAGVANERSIAELMQELFPGAENVMASLIENARWLAEQENTEIAPPPNMRALLEKTQLEEPEEVEESATPIIVRRSLAPELRSAPTKLTIRRGRTTSVAAIAVVLVMIMVITAAISATVSSHLREPEVEPIPAAVAGIEARVEVAPKVAPRTEPIEPAVEPAPEKTAKTKTRPPAAARQVPVAAPEPARPFAELEKKLASLRASPDDVDLFQSLHADIAAAARELPAAEKSRVLSAIDIAVRSGDVEALANALRRLIAHRRASNAASPSNTALSP